MMGVNGVYANTNLAINIAEPDRNPKKQFDVRNVEKADFYCYHNRAHSDIFALGLKLDSALGAMDVSIHAADNKSLVRLSDRSIRETSCTSLMYGDEVNDADQCPEKGREHYHYSFNINKDSCREIKNFLGGVFARVNAGHDAKGFLNDFQQSLEHFYNHPESKEFSAANGSLAMNQIPKGQPAEE